VGTVSSAVDAFKAAGLATAREGEAIVAAGRAQAELRPV
jgi:hypothetical protein